MNRDPLTDVAQLRNSGLTDALIIDELSRRGYTVSQINGALAQLDGGTHMAQYPAYPQQAYPPQQASGKDDTMYSRMEEIAENLIDEKWDELIAEVKKIVEWKEKIEEKQQRMETDLAKLKEDFKTLHQGVLGKLDEYDGRMREVGTDLKAVGKVFKDVVPQFVENVKELSAVTKDLKERK